MSFITTFSSFSVRGFGGNNGAVPSGEGYIAFSDGIIYDIAIDNNNDIIGLFISTLDNKPYIFKYQSNTLLTYWYENDTFGYKNLLVNSNNDYWCISASFIVDGVPTADKFLGVTSTAATQTERHYYYYTSAGLQVSIDTLLSMTRYGTNLYLTSGTELIRSPIGLGTTIIRELPKTYPNNIFNISQLYAMSTGSFWCVGYYGIVDPGNPPNYLYTDMISIGDTSLATGTTRQFSAELYAIDSSDNLYGFSGNTLYVINTSYTVLYYFYSTMANSTATGIAIDDTNNFIYVSFTDDDTDIDYISKMTKTGTPVWTRSLRQGSNTLLGIKKLVLSDDLTTYYLLTDTNIFNFAVTGNVPGTGSYTIDGITYTYATTTDKITNSGSVPTLTAGPSWTSTTRTNTVTSTTPVADIATPLLTWSPV